MGYIYVDNKLYLISWISSKILLQPSKVHLKIAVFSRYSFDPIWISIKVEMGIRNPDRHDRGPDQVELAQGHHFREENAGNGVPVQESLATHKIITL